MLILDQANEHFHLPIFERVFILDVRGLQGLTLSRATEKISRFNTAISLLNTVRKNNSEFIKNLQADVFENVNIYLDLKEDILETLLSDCDTTSVRDGRVSYLIGTEDVFTNILEMNKHYEMFNSVIEKTKTLFTNYSVSFFRIDRPNNIVIVSVIKDLRPTNDSRPDTQQVLLDTLCRKNTVFLF